jgi:hypothetical protein
MHVSQTESKFLNSLVWDCVIFKLSIKESLEYISARYGKPVSKACYERRKSSLVSDKSTDVWLNHFTRVGFVNSHKKQIEQLESIQDDSLRQLFKEMNKENRDEYKILKLKDNIIETAKLLSELNLGTPIISAIKAKLESNTNNDNNTETVQICK